MKKSLNVYEEKKAKLTLKHNKLQAKLDKVTERAEKLVAKQKELKEKAWKLSERIAGINGHLSMKKLGATHFEVREGCIYFFDDAGKEIKEVE